MATSEIKRNGYISKNSWGKTLTIPQTMTTLVIIGITNGHGIYYYNSYTNGLTKISGDVTLSAVKNNDGTVTFTAGYTGELSAIYI